MSNDIHLPEVDQQLKSAIEGYSEEFWESKDRDPRKDLHAYFQYPAMMVPGLQRQLISEVCSLQPMVRNVLDPFIGAGTTMTDCMTLGLNLTGQDINPLAILICRVKKGPFFHLALPQRVQAAIVRIAADTSERIEADFEGMDKWFEPQVQLELSRIRRSIRLEKQLWARRFMWVALAETVRQTSNSRTSTYKLHTRPTEEIESRNISPVEVFQEVVCSNLEDLQCFREEVEVAGYLTRGHYAGQMSLYLKDSSIQVVPSGDATQKYDLLVTSPPYGDNTSTVPYGQHSYLPLQWIDLEDIDKSVVDGDWLRSTYQIDNRSLGGRRSRVIEPLIENVREKSPSYGTVVDSLADEPADRCARVTTFLYDLDKSLDPIVESLRRNAYMVWIMGNRNVGGIEIPSDDILVELLEHRGVPLVTRAARKIVFKRMAARNRISSMIREEHILVFRKAAN